MLKHYIKITFRNLYRTRIHTAINILGLSMGFACAILIILFVKDELTFDNFHSKARDIYRVFYSSERRDGSMVTNSVVPMIMGKTMKENYPEVKATTTWISFQSEIIYNDLSFGETISLASSSFFEIFDFDELEGNLSAALENPNQIVLTQSLAEKYFGAEPALGKTIEIPLGPERQPFVVSAVIEDVPSNSSLQFTSIIQEENAKLIFPPPMITSWNMVAAETYVLLENNSDAEGLESKFPDMVQTAIGDQLDGRRYEVGLQSIRDIHLDTEMPQGIASVSDPKYTFILSAIAVLILAMACMNFINLSLGRSFARAREIGIKKVVGAIRFQLIFQFLSEAIWLAIISLILGLVISYLLLPLFNELSAKNLVFDIGFQNVLIFIALTLFIGGVAGFYPALVMSGFIPAKILKGNLGVGSGKQGGRKGMLLVQLVLSIFLITTTLFMKSQLEFLQNKNLGFNKDQVIVVPVNVPGARGLQETISKGFERSERLVNSLPSVSEVSDVAVSSQTFSGGWMQMSYTDQDQAQHNFNANVVNANFIPMMEIEIMEGRNFINENESDFRRSIIVNEAFVREFDLEDPIGKRIPHDQFADHEIIGVVKDFNFASLHNSVTPAVMAQNPEVLMSGINGLSINSSFNPKAFIKLRAGEVGEGLTSVQKVWEEVYPGESFNYTFLDEDIESQYQNEGNLGKIVTASAILSIIIGSLGIFGLSTLTMTARIKEISIRKVLGASSGNLVISLGKTYLILTILSIFISAPFTIYFIQDWLKSFEYKIGLDPLIFILGSLIALTICVAAIAYQSLKIAFSNPVGNLRSE